MTVSVASGTVTNEWPHLNQAVAAEIRAVMARRGLTQSSLAARMGRDKVWTSRRLAPHPTGRSVSINFDELEEFAQALGTPWWQLLPRLDSNQQPAGNQHRPVARAGARRGHLRAVHTLAA